MKIAYLFQNIGTNYAISRAEQLHVLFTIRELQNLGHTTCLVAPVGKQIYFSENIDAIREGLTTPDHYARLGFSGHPLINLIESPIRWLQSQLKLPYFAFFDSLRTYDVCSRNLASFDILHERFNLPAYGGVFTKKKLNTKYVLELNADLVDQRAQRGIPEKGLRKILSLWNSRLCFSNADVITCTSSALKSQITHRWEIPADKIHILPCAADISTFTQQFDSISIRKTLSLDSEPIIIWVGGYHIWQDLTLLIDGFCELIKTFTNLKLIMIGDGPSRPAIAEKIRENQLNGSVISLGSIPHEKIPEWLSIADIAVSPHPAQLAGQVGTPMKIFEYMAAGKAIVASDIPQISDVIQDGYSGCLVKPGSISEFVNACRSLLGNPELRRLLGTQASQAAVQKHSWQQYASNLVNIYQNL